MRFEKPKDRFYNGELYSHIIDPWMRGVRNTITDMIPIGSQVIEFGCGTGALCRELADHGCSVKGYDISESMIATARKNSAGTSRPGLSFECKDVLIQDPATFGSPDYVILSMILHEQDLPFRMTTLLIASGISRRIIIADYAYPIPGWLNRWMVTAIESMAGKKHFKYFRTYNMHQGMDGLIRDYDLDVTDERLELRGIIRILDTITPLGKNPQHVD